MSTRKRGDLLTKLFHVETRRPDNTNHVTPAKSDIHSLNDKLTTNRIHYIDHLLESPPFYFTPHVQHSFISLWWGDVYTGDRQVDEWNVSVCRNDCSEDVYDVFHLDPRSYAIQDTTDIPVSDSCENRWIRETQGCLHLSALYWNATTTGRGSEDIGIHPEGLKFYTSWLSGDYCCHKAGYIRTSIWSEKKTFCCRRRHRQILWDSLGITDIQI